MLLGLPLLVLQGPMPFAGASTPPLQILQTYMNLAPQELEIKIARTPEVDRLI